MNQSTIKQQSEQQLRSHYFNLRQKQKQLTLRVPKPWHTMATAEEVEPWNKGLKLALNRSRFGHMPKLSSTSQFLNTLPQGIKNQFSMISLFKSIQPISYYGRAIQSLYATRFGFISACCSKLNQVNQSPPTPHQPHALLLQLHQNYYQNSIRVCLSVYDMQRLHMTIVSSLINPYIII